MILTAHQLFLGGQINPLKTKHKAASFKDPVRTAQQTLFISVIKTNQFML